MLPFRQQALQRRAVGERARGGMRVFAQAPQVFARLVAASCTRALPCSSARARSMRLADQLMPPATSSTSARWIATSHQLRLAWDGSGHTELHSRARRAGIALSAGDSRYARRAS